MLPKLSAISQKQWVNKTKNNENYFFLGRRRAHPSSVKSGISPFNFIILGFKSSFQSFFLNFCFFSLKVCDEFAVFVWRGAFVGVFVSPMHHYILLHDVCNADRSKPSSRAWHLPRVRQSRRTFATGQYALHLHVPVRAYSETA